MGDPVVGLPDRRRVSGRHLSLVTLHLPASVRGVRRRHEGRVLLPTEARQVTLHFRSEHGQQEVIPGLPVLVGGATVDDQAASPLRPFPCDRCPFVSERIEVHRNYTSVSVYLL